MINFARISIGTIEIVHHSTSSLIEIESASGDSVLLDYKEFEDLYNALKELKGQ